MLEFGYCPVWFRGKDLLIDLFSLITLLWVAFFGLRYYKLTKKKSYKSFSAAFFIIALSFLFKILTNFTIYRVVTHSKSVGLLTVTYQTVTQSHILYYLGFFFHRLLMLLGLYLLYSTYVKKRDPVIHIIVIYLLIVVSFITAWAYYVFHLTALALLLALSSYYYKSFRRSRLNLSRLVALSFMLMAVSEFVFLSAGFYSQLYVLGEIVQLFAYFILFSTLFMVLAHGKKNKIGHHR